MEGLDPDFKEYLSTDCLGLHVSWSRMLSSILNMNGESSSSSKFCHCCGNALENGYNYCPKCGQEVLRRGNKSSVAHGSRLNGNRTVENHVGTATAPTTRVHVPSNKESVKPSPALECFSAFKKSKEKERSSFLCERRGLNERSQKPCKYVSDIALHYCNGAILCTIISPHFFWATIVLVDTVKIKRCRDFWKIV